MKRINYIVILLTSLIVLGCSDFLDKYPLDEQTEETAFQTYDNFKTYAWGLYEIFPGFPIDGGYLPATVSDESNTDNMIQAQSGKESDYAYQKKIVPASGGDWDFTFIRRVNIMLQDIDNSQMNQADKDHWKSVCYFFRSYRYLNLLAAFGDVPWLDHVVSDTDKDGLYGPRTPRDEVAANILNDLTWAESHIKIAGDGTNTINVNVVRALISRFGLFEGTWRKYHGLKDPEKYLQASIGASQKLITAFPTLQANYDDVYNSEELVGKAGVILAKQYATDMTMHSITRVVRSSAWYTDVSKNAVESYLCTDGKPISTSTVYAGDKSIYDVFKNRDRRLLYSVLPPYKVTLTGPAGTSYGWTYDTNPQSREYIDLMATLTPVTGKQVPVCNWSGYMVAETPHFRNYPNGQGFNVTELGYYFNKFYNRHEDNMALSSSTSDFLIFGIEEVLLNFAEAKCELGQFDQSVADQTVNKLRKRVSMPNMVVADINSSFDPQRDKGNPTIQGDYEVSPLMWEVRRERRIELLGDGFRFRDLKRWKKAHYVNTQILGAWVKNSNYGNKLKIYGGGTEGYVMLFGVPSGWLNKYYLEPIPTKELALNPNLVQNPGW